MTESGPEEPRERERLLPGRLLARVDVDEGEGRLLGIVKRARPGVEFERCLIAEPAEARNFVGN